jgi:hypothetical protein
MEDFLDKIKRELEALKRNLIKFKKEVKKQEAITKNIRRSKRLRTNEKQPHNHRKRLPGNQDKNQKDR